MCVYSRDEVFVLSAQFMAKPCFYPLKFFVYCSLSHKLINHIKTWNQQGIYMDGSTLLVRSSEKVNIVYLSLEIQAAVMSLNTGFVNKKNRKEFQTPR